MNPDNSSNDAICPGCGAPVQGGVQACQALFDEFTTRAYADPPIAALHSLAFEAYCMQHPERYCISAKSYAAHLTRLCCGLEFGGNQQVYRAIQKWLNGKVALDRPEPPEQRGALTVVDLLAARTVEEHRRLVHVWAQGVWLAYAHQQELGRAWLQAALGSPDT